MFEAREEFMKAKVTEDGVVIPKEFPEGIEEVEIRKTDSLLALGQHPANYKSLARRPHTNL